MRSRFPSGWWDGKPFAISYFPQRGRYSGVRFVPSASASCKAISADIPAPPLRMRLVVEPQTTWEMPKLQQLLFRGQGIAACIDLPM